MATDFASLVSQFALQGRFLDARPFGTGHIHDTHLVRCLAAAGETRRYIFQRVNQDVFPDPVRLMENIGRVTGHLRQKISAQGGDPDREALQLVAARGGGAFYRTASGAVWRVFRSIEGARTYDNPTGAAQVQAAGRAYGAFLRAVADLPPGDLHLTIPDFHNTRKRYLNFVQAVERDLAGRAGQVRAEIAFVQARADLTGKLVSALDRGALPVRTTHNDTKLNNIMIDDVTGEGVCVIDLDTVMPGSALYDFGDAIRSIASSAAEDEPDLARVAFRLDYFERFAQGYLEAARPVLTGAETDLFPLGAILMTLECGIRFLADHLNGDIYFKTRRENHNLDRCRTQFKLVREMEDQFDQMAQVINRHR